MVEVTGSSEFAKRNVHSTFVVNFDIKKVMANPHWVVYVNKILKGSWQGSYVDWMGRKLMLDSEDISMRQVFYQGGKTYQYPIVHEFGHTSGNSTIAVMGMHGDEYKTSSIHYMDKVSLMNVGNELRERHLDFILKELNQMIPNTMFRVKYIQYIQKKYGWKNK